MQAIEHKEPEQLKHTAKATTVHTGNQKHYNSLTNTSTSSSFCKYVNIITVFYRS